MMETSEIIKRIRKSRKNFAALGRNYLNTPSVEFSQIKINRTACYWITPSSSQKDGRLIIYLHGGCFALGSIESHGAMVSHIAQELQIKILFVDYSLAPEHKYPVALHEIVNVYKELMTRYKIIYFMGDSAGAALAISVIHQLNIHSICLPKRQILISPWLDFRCTSKSMTENAAIDPILTKEQLEFYRDCYIDYHDVSQANPLDQCKGNRFPPTLIVVGECEILIDDSLNAFRLLKQHQHDVCIKIYKGQTHVWMLDDIQNDASINAIAEMRKFLI